MNFELSYAKAQRPLPTLWAAGLLIMGGVFFLLPIVFTTMVGRAWLTEPGYATLLISTAVLGLGQLASAVGAWRGAGWPRFVVLAVVAVQIVFLVLGYAFVLVGLAFAGTATFLLWRTSARAYAESLRGAGKQAMGA